MRRIALRAAGWLLTAQAIGRAAAPAACRTRDARFTAARTGARNAALDAVAGEPVWLGI